MLPKARSYKAQLGKACVSLENKDKQLMHNGNEPPCGGPTAAAVSSSCKGSLVEFHFVKVKAYT